MKKLPIVLKIFALIVMMLIAVACAPPAVAQEPDSTKLAFNFKIDTTGKTAPILAYVPFKVEGLFGSKLDFQVWTFAGADSESGAFLGGGALVLHTPIAKNLWINVGVDATFKDSNRPVFAGVIGFEILRI